MTQFVVYRNKNRESAKQFPYLLDVQHGLMEPLATRLVVPLSPVALMEGKTIATLMPILEIDGKRFVMVTPEMAGVSRKMLSTEVADVSGKRSDILGAIDFLLTGF